MCRAFLAQSGVLALVLCPLVAALLAAAVYGLPFAAGVRAPFVDGKAGSAGTSALV